MLVTCSIHILVFWNDHWDEKLHWLIVIFQEVDSDDTTLLEAHLNDVLVNVPVHVAHACICILDAWYISSLVPFTVNDPWLVIHEDHDIVPFDILIAEDNHVFCVTNHQLDSS